MSSGLKEHLLFVLGLLICGVMAVVITTDFNDPPSFIPGEIQNQLQPSAQNGAKAAISALAAAAALFGSLNIKPKATAATIFVQLMGAISACVCAWYWLLSETDGKPTPHLLIVLYLVGVFTTGSFVVYIAEPVWKWVQSAWKWVKSV